MTICFCELQTGKFPLIQSFRCLFRGTKIVRATRSYGVYRVLGAVFYSVVNLIRSSEIGHIYCAIMDPNARRFSIGQRIVITVVCLFGIWYWHLACIMGLAQCMSAALAVVTPPLKTVQHNKTSRVVYVAGLSGVILFSDH